MVITQKIDYRLDTPGLLRECPPQPLSPDHQEALGKQLQTSLSPSQSTWNLGFSEAPGRVFFGSLGTLCEVLGYPCVLLFHGD